MTSARRVYAAVSSAAQPKRPEACSVMLSPNRMICGRDPARNRAGTLWSAMPARGERRACWWPLPQPAFECRLPIRLAGSPRPAHCSGSAAATATSTHAAATIAFSAAAAQANNHRQHFQIFDMENSAKAPSGGNKTVRTLPSVQKDSSIM